MIHASSPSSLVVWTPKFWQRSQSMRLEDIATFESRSMDWPLLQFIIPKALRRDCSTPIQAEMTSPSCLVRGFGRRYRLSSIVWTTTQIRGHCALELICVIRYRSMRQRRPARGVRMELVAYLNQTKPWRSLFPESEQSRISRQNVGSASTKFNLLFLEISLE